MANALVARQRLAEVRDPAGACGRAYQEAVKLSTQRYGAGRASYFEVLQAAAVSTPAEVALAQTRRDEYTAVVQLYKALGGGWNLEDPVVGPMPTEVTHGISYWLQAWP